VRVKRDFNALPLDIAALDETPSEGAANGAAEGLGSAVERTVTGLTGRQLNQEWQVGARHALYHHEGHWFHQLRRFPGALFDFNGYVLFRTEEEFRRCPDLNITQDVYVPKGISSMRAYVRCR
jgi:5-methylcytosine-specific restriction protein A